MKRYFPCNWSSTCKSVLLVQLSSAAAERFSRFYLTLLLIGKNIHQKTTSKPLSCYSTIVSSVCTCITGVFLCFMVMINVRIIENNRQLSSLLLE